MSTVSLHSKTEVKKFKLIEIFWYNYTERKLRKRWIWSYLLKKSLIENFIFCAVLTLKLMIQVTSTTSPLKNFFKGSITTPFKIF